MSQHSRKASEVSPDHVTISFGPEVKQEMRILEAIVQAKPDYDVSMYELLKELSSDKPMSIRHAMTSLAMVVQESTEYAERTGDQAVKNATNEMIGHIMGQSKKANPISIVVEPKVRDFQ